MGEYDIVAPRILNVRVVEPANSRSGAKGEIVFSGATGQSGASLFVHNGTIFIPVGQNG